MAASRQRQHRRYLTVVKWPTGCAMGGSRTLDASISDLKRIRPLASDEKESPFDDAYIVERTWTGRNGNSRARNAFVSIDKTRRGLESESVVRCLEARCWTVSGDREPTSVGCVRHCVATLDVPASGPQTAPAQRIARVAELADALDLGSSPARGPGSTPGSRSCQAANNF